MRPEKGTRLPAGSRAGVPPQVRGPMGVGHFWRYHRGGGRSRLRLEEQDPPGLARFLIFNPLEESGLRRSGKSPDTYLLRAGIFQTPSFTSRTACVKANFKYYCIPS